MIIYTNPSIEKLSPIRMSKTIDTPFYKVCLAEVPDSFNLKWNKMQECGIKFWHELTLGYFDHELFDYEFFLNSGGHIVDAIERTYHVSEEKNIALAIHTLSNAVGDDPIEFFNKYSSSKNKTIGWLPKNRWTAEDRLLFDTRGLRPVCWYKGDQIIRVSEVLSTIPKEVVHSCMICDKEIKGIYPETKGKAWEGMFEGGIVDKVSAGYGSDLDGNEYVVAICDACIQKKGLLVGNYLNRGNNNKLIDIKN